VILKLILAASLVATATSGVVVLGSPNLAGATSCGVWRWDVKTLSDPDRTSVDFHAQLARVARLRKLDALGGV
jgi:hypothetical protein